MRVERWFYTIPLKLRSIFRRGRVEAELDEELRAHMERLIDQNARRGMSPGAARAAAQRQMGGIEHTKDACRDARGTQLLDELRQDAHYAARVLRKSPTFTLVAALTLALGVGANATMFGVLDAVALEPLPFREPDQLVQLVSTRNGTVVGGPSALDVRDIARSSRSFEQLVPYDEWRKNVSGLGSVATPDEMIVGLVSKEYFQTLGISPIIGRLFDEGENTYGSHYVAAISRRVWNDRYGGAPSVLGKTFRINDEPYTIVAVMPDVIPAWLAKRGVGVTIWTPFALAPDQWAEHNRANRGFSAIGRLKQGVSVTVARREVGQIADRLATTYPDDRGFGVEVAPLADARSGPLRDILVILVSAVTLVLVITCANLANLMMARNSARRRELVLRTALGASRQRLVRQLLTETLVLALFGGGLGIGTALAARAALIRWHPQTLPQLGDVRLNATVVLFAIGVSLLAALAFGLGPAIATSRVDLAARLRDGGRTISGGARHHGRAMLVVAQVAMSLVLVTSTALLTQSLQHLRQQDLGIRVDHTVKGHVYLPPVRYPNREALTRFGDRFGDALRALPGVQAATVVTGYLPSAARWENAVDVEGAAPKASGEEPTAFLNVGDAWYLRTFGIPLVRGRDLSDADGVNAAPVVIVNQAFERQLLNGENAVGRRLRIGRMDRRDTSSFTIVGVFRDAKNDGLRAPVQPQMVALYAQAPAFNIEFKDVVVRTRGDPQAIVTDVRQALRSIDPDMPLAEVATMAEVVDAASGSLAYTAALMSAFALLGLALAAIGIYGVVAFQVRQQTADIGVRMTVGATQANILWMVLWRGITLALLGAAIGVVGSVAVSGVIGQQTFGVSALDPVTLLAAGAGLIVVAAAASVVPALRAVRIDPVRALRDG